MKLGTISVIFSITLALNTLNMIDLYSSAEIDSSSNGTSKVSFDMNSSSWMYCPTISSKPEATSMNEDFSLTKPFSTTLSKSPSVIPIIGILKRYNISEATREVSSPMVTTKSKSLNL